MLPFKIQDNKKQGNRSLQKERGPCDGQMREEAGEEDGEKGLRCDMLLVPTPCVEYNHILQTYW